MAYLRHLIAINTMAQVTSKFVYETFTEQLHSTGSAMCLFLIILSYGLSSIEFPDRSSDSDIAVYPWGVGARDL